MPKSAPEPDVHPAQECKKRKRGLSPQCPQVASPSMHITPFRIVMTTAAKSFSVPWQLWDLKRRFWSQTVPTQAPELTNCRQCGLRATARPLCHSVSPSVKCENTHTHLVWLLSRVSEMTRFTPMAGGLGHSKYSGDYSEKTDSESAIAA